MSTEPNLINSNKKPLALFEEWFEEAKKTEINDPNAMNLATISSNGKPSSRIVLLKSFDKNGFIFYSNSNSKKGKAIKENKSVKILMTACIKRLEIKYKQLINKSTIS